MKIIDRYESEYRDFKIIDNIIILINEEGEKSIESNLQATYNIEQVKQIFSSRVMFVNLSRHQFHLTLKIANESLKMYFSIDEYQKIINELLKLNLRQTIRTNSKNQKMIVANKTHFINLEHVRKIGIKEYLTKRENIAEIGVWMELDNNKEIDLLYSEIEQANIIISELFRKDSNKEIILIEFTNEKTNLIFLFWMLMCFGVPTFFWIMSKNTFFRPQTFISIILFSNIFMLLVLTITLLVKINELKKYETIIENRTKYSGVFKMVFSKWFIYILIINILIVSFRYLLLAL